MYFTKLRLDEDVLRGIKNAGFETCTDVQAQTIPNILNGYDVMVQSQTGTGKTAAFLIPVIQLLLHHADFKQSTALIIAPTRELAVQIKEEADLLSEDMRIETAVFYGGVGYKTQEKALRNDVDIMIGTPGRILDLSKNSIMDLKKVRLAVIDEADRLFDMGFFQDTQEILRRMCSHDERLNMLFSATLSTKVRDIAWKHMNNPQQIEIHPEKVTVNTVRQFLYHVSAKEKMSVLLLVLKKYSPRTGVIFTNTKRAAEEIAKRMQINDYPTEFIIGDLPQRKRLSIIRKIKAGETEFLVATDVAARGLHIDNLDIVVNYDLPQDPESYVHRIGRTARAGESGLAVSLACPQYVFSLEAIEKLIGKNIPVEHVSTEDVLYDKSRSNRSRVYGGASGNTKAKPNAGNAVSNGYKKKYGGTYPARKKLKRNAGMGKQEAVSELAGKKRSKYTAAKQSKNVRHRDARTSKHAPVDNRLEYYQKKYGETFTLAEKRQSNTKKSPALKKVWKKLKNLFGEKQ